MNGSSRAVSNQADKDKKDEETTNRSPSVPVISKKNGALSPMDNQGLPPIKKEKGEEDKERDETAKMY